MVKYHGPCGARRIAHATVVAKNRASHCRLPLHAMRVLAGGVALLTTEELSSQFSRASFAAGALRLFPFGSAAAAGELPSNADLSAPPGLSRLDTATINAAVSSLLPGDADVEVAEAPTGASPTGSSPRAPAPAVEELSSED